RVACQLVQVSRRIVYHTCIMCENKRTHSTKMASVVSTILPVTSCEFYSIVGLGSVHKIRWPSVDPFGPANRLESGMWNECMSTLQSVTASQLCLRGDYCKKSAIVRRMLYLEDFVELIEQLPAEMRDRSTEIRMLDLQVQRGIDQAAKAAKEFFDQAPNLSREEQNRRYAKLKEEYKRIREQADEKVAIVETMYTLLEKYMQRLNKEVLHFKYELEADNPGVTEQIEKKIVESEKAQIVQRKERRRRGHDSVHGSSSATTNGNLSSIKLEPSTSLSRGSAHKSNSSASAAETNHIELSSSMLNGRSSFTQHDDETASAGNTGGAGSRVRGSTATQERDPDLPPLKKRSATNPKQLIAITNVASSPALSSLSPLSEKGGERWVPPSASSTPPVHSPVTGFSKTPHQVHVSAPNSCASSSNATSLANGTSMLTFAGQESRHGRPRKLTSRVQEMLKDTMQRHERRMPNHHSPEQDDGSDGDDSDHDNDKRTWCVCNQKSYGCMVACDNKSCPIEWFHYECVNLTQPPKGKWYCPHCTQTKQRRSVSLETF
uniref:Inhibitor of growth protein n=1 Tax=Parascaris univalens TaxID=6257 RepID=A0A915ATQ9_PARUN